MYWPSFHKSMPTSYTVHTTAYAEKHRLNICWTENGVHIKTENSKKGIAKVPPLVMHKFFSFLIPLILAASSPALILYVGSYT